MTNAAATAARTPDHVVTVNGTVHVVTDALDAEFAAARYRAAYRLAIVKIVPLAEYELWAPGTATDPRYRQAV